MVEAADIWELYSVDPHFSETNELSASNPDKLEALQAFFVQEAERYRVLCHRWSRVSAAVIAFGAAALACIDA